jgi:drug/metabolite transporter (DMT)-like permease
MMVLISLLYFGALREMPLAQATAIFFTTPMMTTLFATIFLRERPGLSIWLSIIAGFVGVLIVIRPGGELPLRRGCGLEGTSHRRRHNRRRRGERRTWEIGG